MKALIFGINGQDGYYLNTLLSKNGLDVIGVSRNNDKWILGDVGDFNFVSGLIKSTVPDYIFHLAANSTTRHDTLFENHETISTGTINILESAYKYSPNSKIFISGSGLQFVNNGLPISETDEFDPSSPYAVARIQSVYASRYYRKLGLKVFVGYFFNHDSPLRSERHVNQKIIMAAKRISEGGKEELQLGDISVKKEFGFAGDIVEAIWAFVNNRENIFETTIGTGLAFSIEDWLDICFGKFKIDWKPIVSIQPDFKSEYKILVSDPSTVFSMDWQPRIDIYNLSNLMFNHIL